MPLPPGLQDAVALPSGARWVRAALQVNPYGYKGAHSPAHKFSDEATYNAALVAELQRCNVELVAITDHWNVQSASSLMAACSAAGITALPGFEANSSEGIHLLVIFEAGTPYTEVTAAIGACGASPGATGTTGNGFSQLVKDMTSRGALVIAPHVNTDSGLLGKGLGAALANKWTHPELHIAGVSPGLPLSQAQQDVLNNRNPNCARPHPIAQIHCDDICTPDRIAGPGATTWFRMTEPSLAGLRLAARIPGPRISLSDPKAGAHPVIQAIAWDGGFLDGVRLRLSDSLSTIIGGRGAGKSTLIESLRFALDVSAIGERASADHREVVAKVLGPVTSVSVLIEVQAPHPAQYVIQRTVPDPPVVRDMAGTVLARRPVDVLGTVDIFSQQELAELSDSDLYVGRMLSRLSGPDPDDDKRADLKRALSRNREEYLAALADIEAIDEKLAALPRLQEQLRAFQTAKMDERLKSQEQIEIERAFLGEARTAVEGLIPRAETLRTFHGLQVAAPSATEPADVEHPRQQALANAESVLHQLGNDVSTLLATLDRLIAVALSGVDTAQSTWETATAELRSEHEKVLRELQLHGHHPSEYLATSRRVRELETEREKRSGLESRSREIWDARLQLLGQQEELYAARRSRLSAASKLANDQLRGRVIIRPTLAKDRAHIEQLIKSHVSGQKTQILGAVNREDFSPKALAAACRGDALESFGIQGAQARQLVAAGEALFLELEECEIDLAAEAQLNVSSDGTEYRGLHELSKGQKATALLLLLLTQSDAPLIIDQPEDNLDNRFIYQDIVPRLHAAKGHRQIVAATHNANIPILGDADLVVVMEGSGAGGACAQDGVGSIDDPTVRALAEAILEGGREAFERRRHLYGV